MKTAPWLSVNDISKHLGISKETIYRWLEEQKIPAHRVGKLWKFQTLEIDNWVKKGGAVDTSLKKSTKGKILKSKSKSIGSHS